MKTAPFPARLTQAQQNALQRIAEACGVKKADVLGWAVDAIGAYFDANGGKLIVPLRFEPHTVSSQVITNQIEQKGKSHKARQSNK